MVQKSGDHHLACMKPCKIIGIFTISTGDLWDFFHQRCTSTITCNPPTIAPKTSKLAIDIHLAIDFGGILWDFSGPAWSRVSGEIESIGSFEEKKEKQKTQLYTFLLTLRSNFQAYLN